MYFFTKLHSKKVHYFEVRHSLTPIVINYNAETSIVKNVYKLTKKLVLLPWVRCNLSPIHYNADTIIGVIFLQNYTAKRFITSRSDVT